MLPFPITAGNKCIKIDNLKVYTETHKLTQEAYQQKPIIISQHVPQMGIIGHQSLEETAALLSASSFLCMRAAYFHTCSLTADWRLPSPVPVLLARGLSRKLCVVVYRC